MPTGQSKKTHTRLSPTQGDAGSEHVGKITRTCIVCRGGRSCVSEGVRVSSDGLAGPGALFALSRVRWEAAFLVCAPIARHGVVFSPPQGCVPTGKALFLMLVHGTWAPGRGLEETPFAQNTWAQGSWVGLACSQVSDLIRVTSPGLCFLTDVRDPLGTLPHHPGPHPPCAAPGCASLSVGCSGLLHFRPEGRESRAPAASSG